ncbi:circadian clock protein KaiB [candidate division WOR-3 bacterium]|nr:circadian clock protein KaiB [candidate division WOR-3 bacterium]MCK4575502.1 circadian clock protein KaiB [candidate division WOR-3 bacterium]
MYKFRLYVTAKTQKSKKPIDELKKLLENEFANEYSLEIINVFDNLKLAESDKILATPTLIKLFPPPPRRIIGDFSNASKVMFGLGLKHITEKK